MNLETFENCQVQVFVDDADRRSVSVTLSSGEFEEVAKLLGYKVQNKDDKIWFEAPMTRDRLKLQFVWGE